jgi:SOCE-associated regulatory factor of calcium homoeostasis
MRCENAGADYDEGSVQWTCKADIPNYFKLGSTEVKCEGYDSPRDPHILKGSCGVEYRLLLTESGEAKYGSSFSISMDKSSSTLSNLFFWIIFLGVAFWIISSAIRGMRRGNNNDNNNQAPRRPPFDGWGGGGGGGGGGWFGGNDRPNDPPPPYSQFPSRKRPAQQQQPHAANEGWRPGFWTGVLGGGAGGYWLGNRNSQRDRQRGGAFYRDNPRNDGWRNSGFNQNNDRGEGSSGSGTTYTSTGFGGTTNR